MSDNKVIVLAYGTLRKGYGNSRLVDKGDNFIGTGLTVEKYQMKASGIPYVNKTPDTQIVVDVWEIDAIKDLPAVDRLEGYNPNNHEDSWYKRELIQVEVNDKIVEGYLYFNNSNGTIVESGDYAKYR